MAHEVFDRDALQEYLTFVMEHDVQILANRREARTLYMQAVVAGFTTADPFYFPVEKAEKIQTFLELHETQRNDAGGQVNVYAFIRLMGDLRRNFYRNVRPRQERSAPPSQAPSEGAPLAPLGAGGSALRPSGSAAAAAAGYAGGPLARGALGE